ncbi:uncharacterized protein PV07_01493 [Cladophialophora immunda]|uniref:Uncharacterized protein n=1 Tax=Cladophialophora immunda TaxID=569365 RepID=A0A0D2CXU6_9EURO|nr:uncharacterized protein PV07_01493 [Cladophialophora immunda]KIW34735.1 hypothetical protein PV07_01493 [Cladophialophora immunda]
MPVKQLFTKVTKYIIRISGSLRILCSVESPKYVERDALSSWVPDWRAPRESIRNVLHDRNPRSGYRATMNSVHEFDYTADSDELQVNGIAIGIVSQAGRYNDFHTLSDFNLQRRYGHTNQPITTALRQAQTLSFDIDVQPPHIVGAGHPQRRSLAAFYDLPGRDFHRQECDQCPNAHPMPILSMENASQDPDLFSIARSCLENVSSRAFFATNTNYVGFGPTCTAPGDQVYLLLGSDVPFILRPAGEKFKLVGACYVHGIMYGEGLHRDIMINHQFYPGSIPGSDWDFSNDRLVTPATWKSEPEGGGNLARTNGRRFWLCQEERDPLLIEAQRVVLR